MIVAACDACEKSIIIRSAIIEEEIVAFVFIVVFVVIFLFVFIDERQKSLRVVFLSVFSTLKRSSSTLEKSTKLFLFRVLEFFFFVLFLFPREATIFKTTTRHLLRAL
jgi:hypothetical protein